MTLEVEICTYGLDGLQRAAQMTLPAVDGVRYRICMQNPDGLAVELPEALRRPDVDFFQHPTRGLSLNRNAALDRAEADIILIADDDLSYSAEGLRAVIDTFAADPALDFATFQYSGPDNRSYPAESFVHTFGSRRGYSVASVEIAIRRSSLPAAVRMSPHAGIGADVYGAGEEYIFVHRLILSGLRGKFIPTVICHHPSLSTGVRTATRGVDRATGLVSWIDFTRLPRWYRFTLGPLRVIARAVDNKVRSPRRLCHILEGYFLGFKYFNSDLSDRQ